MSEPLGGIQIVVHGSPAPQGSKKFVGVHNGHGMMVESSKAVRPWREAVKAAAIEAMQGAGKGLSGAVTVEMIFTLPKPKSAPKSRRTWPDRKPDLSKLIRSTEDALTDAGVWEDDARVVDCLARKVFTGEHPDALKVPGAVIRVRSRVERESDSSHLFKPFSRALTQRFFALSNYGNEELEDCPIE